MPTATKKSTTKKAQSKRAATSVVRAKSVTKKTAAKKPVVKKSAAAKKAVKKVTKKTGANKTAAKTTKNNVAKKGTKKASSKKSSKKTTATKTKRAAKKAPTRSTANTKVLVCANAEECFWVADGQVLKDLTELATALEVMSNKVFKHHVCKGENHFADWVEHVLCDAECAHSLRQSTSRAKAKAVVVRRLKLYTL